MKGNILFLYYYLTFRLCQRNNKDNDRQTPLSFISGLFCINLYSISVFLGNPLNGASRNGVYGAFTITGLTIYFTLSYYFLKNDLSRKIVRFYNAMYENKKLNPVSIILVILYYLLTLFCFGYACYFVYKKLV